jgi:hypothetical protein
VGIERTFTRRDIKEAAQWCCLMAKLGYEVGINGEVYER